MTTQLPPSAGTDESARYLTAIEAEMNRFFHEQSTTMRAVSPETLPLIESISALSTGGKRLRALLAYWGYRGAGGTECSASIVRAGLAIELFQTAALIHDDIIDASDTRRGAPSVHRRFEAMHRERGYKTNAASFGVSSALLAGDLCLSWSEMVFSSIPELTATSEARFIFDVMRTEVMAGQYLDIVGEVVPEEEPQVALQRALNVIRYKAAKYTCEHPVALGGALGLGLGRDQKAQIIRGYRDFALPLGEGYQLRDDILGVFGEPETTGKPAGDDLREGKRTVLTAFTAMKASPEERALLEMSLGDPKLDATTIAQIQRLMRESRALDEVEALISEKSDQALSALSALPIPEEVRDALHTIALKALQRSY
ncbi:polyprenyl synthetase [Rothia nasimurium]|uniref:Polyprenyl synthetase n=1 Tax=Rothia nasimurium TaxID=85336 RepID=A0A1Y1RPU2_9MICC|nr:polyprenyl synthetase family protein [Rothia nasimurium]ORC18922.1 polyprenyl synthetase [Rothia nasimurium]